MSNPTQGAASTRRRAVLAASVVALAVLLAILLVARTGPPPPPLEAPVDPLYPDLGVAPLGELLVGHEDGGRVYLRFSATLVNTGSGPLLVTAHRAVPFGDDWQVVQRIEDRAGGYSERSLGTRLVFGGDGHEHWHAVGAMAHQLETMDGQAVAGLVKSGFCFFDNVEYRNLPGMPSSPEHAAQECGTPFDRDITMGLSVGWGDEYQWYLLDQAIEFSAVPDGRYRLRATADPENQLVESDESNNDGLTDVEISTVDSLRRVTPVDTGIR